MIINIWWLSLRKPANWLKARLLQPDWKDRIQVYLALNQRLRRNKVKKLVAAYPYIQITATTITMCAWLAVISASSAKLNISASFVLKTASTKATILWKYMSGPSAVVLIQGPVRAKLQKESVPRIWKLAIKACTNASNAKSECVKAVYRSAWNFTRSGLSTQKLILFLSAAPPFDFILFIIKIVHYINQ